MIIGVDVGGTFTDVFFLDEASQKIEIAKVPSTPEDSSRGFLQGLGTHAKDWSKVGRWYTEPPSAPMPF